MTDNEAAKAAFDAKRKSKQVPLDKLKDYMKPLDLEADHPRCRANVPRVEDCEQIRVTCSNCGDELAVLKIIDHQAEQLKEKEKVETSENVTELCGIIDRLTTENKIFRAGWQDAQDRISELKE